MEKAIKRILVIEGDVNLRFINAKAYDLIIAYRFVLDKIRNYRGEKIAVADDTMTALDFWETEFEASRLSDTLFDQYTAGTGLATFLGGNEADASFTRLLLKKKFSEAVARVFLAFRFLELVRQRILKDRDGVVVHFMPAQVASGIISMSIYSLLRDNGMVPRDIVIPFSYRWFLRALETVKNICFMAKIALLPEAILLRSSGWSGATLPPRKKYNVGAICEIGMIFGKKPACIDYIVDGVELKKEDIVFIVDEAQNNRFYRDIKNQADQYGYHLVNFFSGYFSGFGFFSVLRKYYACFHSRRGSFFSAAMKRPFFASKLFRAYRDCCHWESFYGEFGVKSVFSIMNPGEATRGWCARRHGAESLFLYNSVTHPRLDKNGRNLAEFVYYSHMMFDAVISDRLTDSWLAGSQNQVKRYIDNGILFSDHVFVVRTERKTQVRRKLNIPENVKLITYFDNTMGYRGIMNVAEYRKTLRTLLRLLLENKDYHLALKFKKGSPEYYFSRYPQIIDDMKNLLACDRAYDVNNRGCEPYEIMGMTDLAIVSPLSSVLYEAVVGGVRVVSYDSGRRYDQKHFITENIPHFSAHGFEELAICVRYWLKTCDDKAFAKFQDDYIKQYVDPHCDGGATKRLRRILFDADRTSGGEEKSVCDDL